MSEAALLDPAMDAMFWRPARTGVVSAWYGHVPFAHWIVAAARPGTLVELGTHAGVSYGAFCDAVQRLSLPTNCLAVDTWQGDEHAGFYDEGVYADLRDFHDARYSGFSQLLRGTFDAALGYVADGSIDLLHIDGRHHYDDVAHDYASWAPKLSSRAVVLFHDTNVRERDFGVWRLWSELRQRHPGFEFLHAHGLGVLCVGADAPSDVLALSGLTDPADIGRVRERFAALGERCVLESRATEQSRGLDDLRAHVATLETKFAEMAKYATSLEGGADGPRRTLDVLQAQARTATARATAAELELRHAAARSAVAEAASTRAIGEGATARAQAERDGIRAARAEARAEMGEHAIAALSDAELGRNAAERALAIARRQVAELTETAATAQSDAGRHAAENRMILASTSWRVSAPLRAISGTVRRRPPSPPLAIAAPVSATPELDAVLGGIADDDARAVEVAPVADIPLPELDAVFEAPAPLVSIARHPKLRVLYAAGEPGTPGCEYRCVRYAEAARAAGHDADWIYVEEINGQTLIGVDLVVLWRVPWSVHVEGIVTIVRGNGGRVALDLDDLMIRPELARISTIDGIRSIQSSEGSVRDMFTRMRQTLEGVDFATATTDELAHAMRDWLHAAYVLPNGFDHATLAASRAAVRQRGRVPHDGLLRVGYAGGTRTHQKDFAIVAPAITALLTARADARLVLFYNRLDKIGLVLLYEFPELEALEAQIEWREQVSLAGLPAELARFDINLAPLLEGNPFVEAKSELKWFEAALAGVATIASPTGPYRRAIADGVTGILASTPDEWAAAITRLADDPDLRARIARDAYHAILWTFGPERRAMLTRSFLDAQMGGEPAAGAFVDSLHRRTLPTLPPPVVTPTEILFAHDAGGAAEVTVIVPSYNYADTILEALESVRVQTLDALDLVIVDDRSPDPETIALILDFAHSHSGRFNRLLVLRHLTNAGLGGTRNTGFSHAETPYVLPLDADNRLRPECAETLLKVLRGTLAGFAYPRRQFFGGSEAQQGGDRFEPQRLVVGNYIDAMAMVAKWAWAAAGGYYVRRDAMGWEDFDLWCRMAELGLWGVGVADVLTEYRVHAGSMVNAITEQADNKRAMVSYVEQRHPWLDVLARETALRH